MDQTLKIPAYSLNKYEDFIDKAQRVFIIGIPIAILNIIHQICWNLIGSSIAEKLANRRLAILTSQAKQESDTASQIQILRDKVDSYAASKLKAYDQIKYAFVQLPLIGTIVMNRLLEQTKSAEASKLVPNNAGKLEEQNKALSGLIEKYKLEIKGHEAEKEKLIKPEAYKKVESEVNSLKQEIQSLKSSIASNENKVSEQPKGEDAKKHELEVSKLKQQNLQYDATIKTLEKKIKELELSKGNIPQSEELKKLDAELQDAKKHLAILRETADKLQKEKDGLSLQLKTEKERIEKESEEKIQLLNKKHKKEKDEWLFAQDNMDVNFQDKIKDLAKQKPDLYKDLFKDIGYEDPFDVEILNKLTEEKGVDGKTISPQKGDKGVSKSTNTSPVNSPLPKDKGDSIEIEKKPGAKKSFWATLGLAKKKQDPKTTPVSTTTPVQTTSQVIKKRSSKPLEKEDLANLKTQGEVKQPVETK